MLIPENIIYNNVKSLLALVKEDYEENDDKTKTILHAFLDTDDNDESLDLHRFNYLKQGVGLFVDAARGTSSRSIHVTMGYNTQRQGLPTIHILLPNESKYEIGIGMGEGYQDSIDDLEEGTRRAVYTNVQKATYNLMLTSDNSSEVVLMYHTLKNLLFSAFPAFALRGIRDLEFGGQDVQFNNELMPDTVFHRNLTMTFFYESHVPALILEKIVGSICFAKGQINDEFEVPLEEQ